jgi:hypothetical protein
MSLKLTDFEVAAAPEVDYAIMVKGNYGQQRVIAEIARIDLDDYFEDRQPNLTDADRQTLVEDNAEIIAGHMQRKCETGEWKDENRFSSTVKRVEINLQDLRKGPRLTDEKLATRKAASASEQQT